MGLTKTRCEGSGLAGRAALWLAGGSGDVCRRTATLRRRRRSQLPPPADLLLPPTHTRCTQARQASLRSVSFKATDGSTTTLDAKKLQRKHSKALLEK